ncbi:MAG: zinc-ribbon domain-containing protein [Nitrospinota bacterium]|nr:zinc-ribbon domain-containing protein [Nitrospinota bacterium]
MKISCTNCHKVISIPDNLVPASGSKVFKCPSCKGSINVFRGAGDKPLDQTQDVVLPSKGSGVKGLPATGGVLDHEIDLLGEGKYKALVADTQNASRVSPVLKKLDYQITLAGSQEDGYKKLQANTYDLIFINEKFGGTDPSKNAIHKFLEPLTMDKRRNVFIVVVGKNLKTLDEYKAFSLSVDMVFNEGEFSNFELLLRKALKDTTNKYKVYKHVLKETGRGYDL